MLQSPLRLAALLLSALCVAFLLFNPIPIAFLVYSLHHNDGKEDCSYWGDFPRSLVDYVRDSDLIVDGTVIEAQFLGYSREGYDSETGELIIDYLEEGPMPIATLGPDELPEGWTDGPVFTHLLPGTPFTDYRVKVNRVWRGEELPEGAEITLRMTGTPEHGDTGIDSCIAPSRVGDRYLLVLGEELDRDYFWLRFGQYSRLRIHAAPTRSGD
jgi:hypothetical protein